MLWGAQFGETGLVIVTGIADPGFPNSCKLRLATGAASASDEAAVWDGAGLLVGH
jgi:hypothetical protein